MKKRNMKRKKANSKNHYLITLILMSYVILCIGLVIGTFSTNSKQTPEKITGHTANGRVAIFIGNVSNITAPVTTPIAVEHEKGCTSNWDCKEWSGCNNNGIKIRSCIDLDGCVAARIEYQGCVAAVIEKPKPTPSGYFIGDFTLNNEYTAELGVNENWMFIYKNNKHYVTLKEITESNVVIEVESRLKKFVFGFGDSVGVDLDEDKIEDLRIKVVQTNDNRVKFTFFLIKEAEIRVPAENRLLQIKNQLTKTQYFNISLLAIVLSLLVILIYQYKKYIAREIKIDHRLKDYITAALNKGFTEHQIKTKLIQDGITLEEINYILNKINKNNKKIS